MGRKTKGRGEGEKRTNVDVPSHSKDLIVSTEVELSFSSGSVGVGPRSEETCSKEDGSLDASFEVDWEIRAKRTKTRQGRNGKSLEG